MPEAKWIDEKNCPPGERRIFVFNGVRYWVFRHPSNPKRLRFEPAGDEDGQKTLPDVQRNR